MNNPAEKFYSKVNRIEKIWKFERGIFRAEEVAVGIFMALAALGLVYLVGNH